MVLLKETTGMLGFLFVDEARFAIDEAAAAKVLGAGAEPVLAAALEAVAAVGSFEASAIEEALRGALIDGLELKPKLAFGPVRVAITGRQVSPPLFESMELLGRERCTMRLTEALGRVRATTR
jgi:glutamyl-tRNA synthetase